MVYGWFVGRSLLLLLLLLPTPLGVCVTLAVIDVCDILAFKSRSSCGMGNGGGRLAVSNGFVVVVVDRWGGGAFIRWLWFIDNHGLILYYVICAPHKVVK